MDYPMAYCRHHKAQIHNVLAAWEKLSQMLIRSGQIPSPRQTSIDKTNDWAMASERGALVRGSDPPYGHSIH